MELNNPVCTIQLRNIVYIHNQLVKYGEKIFVKGFRSENVIDESESDGQSADAVSAAQSEEQEDADDAGSESSELPDMDPVKMIMEQFGNQYIILRVYGKTFIEQTVLNKSINLLIRTRIFENFNELARCKDCHAVVHEGLIPAQRFKEGLNMKIWRCGNPECAFLNKVEMSLQCKKCNMPRPPKTVPPDLMFPLYVPLNPMTKINRQVTIMERLLYIVPLLEDSDDPNERLEVRLKKIKTRERKKDVNDLEKINAIDDFLGMREDYLNSKGVTSGNNSTEMHENNAKKVRMIEDEFYESLCERIQQNMERRLAHQNMLDRNNGMIRELKERAKHVALKQK